MYAFLLTTEFIGCFFFKYGSVFMQPAKKVYESLLGDGVNATTFSHIQVWNFFLNFSGLITRYLNIMSSMHCNIWMDLEVFISHILFSLYRGYDLARFSSTIRLSIVAWVRVMGINLSTKK